MDDSFLWWRDGVIYQIYPRSFADSNGDGIGDLRGILARMDYLVDLGVDAIWLSPVYPSPDVDFGYDVSDYTAIDPKFGSLADFDELVRVAHTRGIRVVMDMVFNHTSDQHPWFQEARKSRENPYHDYYLWQDAKKGGGPPNNWLSVFGGPGWKLDAPTGQMYFHMFYPQQPDLNWQNPAVRQAVLDVFRFWMERGVDGFRLDVFNAYFKHPQFADNAYGNFGLRPFDWMIHSQDMDRPELIPFLRVLRQLLDGYPERYAVGETFLGPSGKAARYTGTDLLHATFNFDLLESRWLARAFARAVQRWEHLLSPDGWPTWVLNNHDKARSASRFTRDEDDRKLKVAAALTLTLRGTPFLYYGEEIGMRDIRLGRSQILDPIGKQYWPFFQGRDGCRAPMQWSGAAQAGFTQGQAQPWLPLHPDYPTRNVEAMRADPDSLLNFYRQLITLRKLHPALQKGIFTPVPFDTRFIMAYLRQTKDETLLVALNFSRHSQRLVLGGALAHGANELLLSSTRHEAPVLRDGVIALGPFEALIVRLE